MLLKPNDVVSCTEMCRTNNARHTNIQKEHEEQFNPTLKAADDTTLYSVTLLFSGGRGWGDLVHRIVLLKPQHFGRKCYFRLQVTGLRLNRTEGPKDMAFSSFHRRKDVKLPKRRGYDNNWTVGKSKKSTGILSVQNT
jgi:hypothetical protein